MTRLDDIRRAFEDGGCIQTDDARWLIAQAAELERLTGGDVVPLKNHCERCKAPLNNVSPGFSIIRGVGSVCANCIRHGDVEVARAKGM